MQRSSKKSLLITEGGAAQGSRSRPAACTRRTLQKTQERGVPYLSTGAGARPGERAFGAVASMADGLAVMVAATQQIATGLPAAEVAGGAGHHRSLGAAGAGAFCRQPAGRAGACKACRACLLRFARQERLISCWASQSTKPADIAPKTKTLSAKPQNTVEHARMQLSEHIGNVDTSEVVHCMSE